MTAYEIIYTVGITLAAMAALATLGWGLDAFLEAFEQQTHARRKHDKRRRYRHTR